MSFRSMETEFFAKGVAGLLPKLTAAGSVNHAPLLMKSEGFQRFSVYVKGTD